MKSFLRVMKALSDMNRVKIVKMLREREMCVCELQEALGIAQPTVSRHLKILEDAGLVRWRKDGLWVNYHLAAADTNPYAAAMLRQMDGWLGDEPEIGQMLRRLPEIRREDIKKKGAVGEDKRT